MFKELVGVLQRLAMLSNKFVICFVPICPCIALRFSCLVWSTDCDASLMPIAISLSCCRASSLAISRPGIALARCKIRRVGILSEVVSITSVGQMLNWDMILWTCACAANPISVFCSLFW